MASMESMAMVAAVQCDGDGSICFSSAAKAHVACTVPRITNHATTFGTAHNCSLWSHDCHRSASWPTTAVYRGQRTCAHAAWQIFCCMNHIKLARDQLAKRGGIHAYVGEACEASAAERIALWFLGYAAASAAPNR